jgi:molecular chaperone DnaJ
MKFHPDRNPGDKDAEEKFKEAKEASEILGDSEKRASTISTGTQGIDASRQGGARGGFRGRDAFGEMFGEMLATSSAAGRRGGGRSQVFRGADLKYELEIELGQAVFGHSVEIDVAKLMECDTCGGSGAAKGHKPVTCDTCNGVGQVRISQGFFQLQQPCPEVPRHRHHYQESLRQLPRGRVAYGAPSGWR